MPDVDPPAPSPSEPTPDRVPSPAFPAPEIPPGMKPRARPGRLLHPDQASPGTFSPEQRVMVLDCWRRSGLPAADFAPLIGVSRHTLYTWKRRFEKDGPAGLVDLPRGAPSGSRVPELTRRAILLIKEANPDYGCERISDLLARGPALQASAGTVAKVLKEAGYVFEEIPLRTHEDHPRRFERPRPNQLWQTDLFTFILKRQNRRVYLVAFMDDFSRFVVSFGLHASQSTPLVMEVLRAAISCYRPPEEVLTDNGSQYVTWRGRSAFARELEKRGIRHIVSAPRHPQTLGKIERFWGTLWRECVESAVFLDLEDARRRIGHFIDHYNFQRPHRGLEGLVPADRYFDAASEVRKALADRVAANALELSRNGIPRNPFYIAGQVGGKPFTVHAEGERVILSRGQGREEIELASPPPSSQPPAPPPEMPNPICPDGSPDERSHESSESPGELTGGES